MTNEDPFVTLPTETAARGLHVFIEAQARTAFSTTLDFNANGSLRQAVFWTGFRQEFHMAFSQQRPFRLPLSLSVMQDHLVWTPAIDAVWTNRLLIIGARVIQYCYDDTFPGYGSVAGYCELVSLRDKWVHSRPISFSPVYVEEPHRKEESFFPGIWYIDDCHIVAAQTLSLLDILFAAYSPYIPRIGPALHLEMENVNEKLRTTVLKICGIAVSNKQSAPALTTAYIAVSICAERFVGCCQVQRALMDVVVDMGRELNYWPARVVRDRLEVVWGELT